MKIQIFIGLTCLGLLFGGCAGKDYDPQKGGFFGGVAGLSSGGYKDRVQDREARLAQLRATQQQLNAETAGLEGQKSAALVKVGKDKARVSSMQAEIASLDKKSKALAAKDGADKQRVADLQKRTAALKKQMAKQSSSLDALEGSGLGDQEVDLRRKQLEQQRNALRREYELLMKMQMELAR
ncbi:MAG: hypothetical protein GX751_05395 [Desulfuromonadaceae bacterium]|nr:hypothetical protein [Desulfuromonadaceae bacterium]